MLTRTQYGPRAVLFVRIRLSYAGLSIVPAER